MVLRFTKAMRNGMNKAGWNLMIALCLVTVSLSGNAQIYVGDTLTENTTWSKTGQDYIVVQSVIVPKGITLTIEPGVKVLFEVNTALEVRGTLIAQGTPSDSIMFLPEDDLWNGIYFHGALTEFDDLGNYTGGTILSYARFENSAYSVVLQENTGILIEHCCLKRASFGIYMKDALNNVIRNCRIGDSDFGIFMASSYVAQYNLFLNNAVTNNRYVGFFINNSSGQISHNTISGNNVSGNLVGLYLGNDGPVDEGYNQVSENIFNNNSFGIRLFQDTSVIERNYIVNSLINGIEIIGACRSTVRNNLISGNNLWGIVVEQGASDNLIKTNSVEHNQNGILFTPGKTGSSLFNSFVANSVHHNADTAFSFMSVPQGLFVSNSIYENRDSAAFLNHTAQLIEAVGNWWGTSDTNTINTFISDVFDDPAKGLVNYQPFHNGPDTEAPVKAPAYAVKKDVGNGIQVSWPPNTESDLAGYRIHYGTFDGFNYQYSLEAGTDTSIFLQGVSLDDTIAVTAVDTEFDGLFDRPEGHESDFTIAIPGPWAGPNSEVCENGELLLSEATANGYNLLSWTTTGDGTFDNPGILHPVYTPGQGDVAIGAVYLTLHISGEGFSLDDEMRVKVRPAPYVFAGSDTTIISGSHLLLSSAAADYFTGLHWLTLGDGTFSNDSVKNPDYFPGAGDLASGHVNLILDISSPCGPASDTIKVQIVEGYFIKGRVHAGGNLVPGSTLNLYRCSGNTVSAMRSTLTAMDGTFIFDLLIEGEYYIYAIPPVNLADQYAPTYYFNDLSWENAYRFNTEANTYDVDIELFKLPHQIPEGPGSISGSCETGGPFLCGDVTILLYDKTLKYLLGWQRLDDEGNFNFRNLPFGDYVLVGEKAGYQKNETPLISLTPEQPAISGILVKILPFKIGIAVPEGYDPSLENIVVAPNPTHDIVSISGLADGENYRIILRDTYSRLLGITGRSQGTGSLPLDLSLRALPAGLYFIEIQRDNGIVTRYKIIKE